MNNDDEQLNSNILSNNEVNCTSESVMCYRDRRINNILKYISEVCLKNNISDDIVNIAMIFYKQIINHKYKTGPKIGQNIIIRGETNQCVIVACVYNACTIKSELVNCDTVAKYFGLNRNQMKIGIRLFDKFMKDINNNTQHIDTISTNLLSNNNCCDSSNSSIISQSITNHSDENILIEKILQVNVIPNEIYYHYKSPHLKYKILMVVLDEETEEPIIIYQAQYGNNLVWARKINIWNQIIEHNGKLIPRFTKDC